MASQKEWALRAHFVKPVKCGEARIAPSGSTHVVPTRTTPARTAGEKDVPTRVQGGADAGIYASSTIVTGPSLTSDTSMRAPKRPRATAMPSSSSAAQNRSYSGSASSGFAASPKLGRLPFRVSATRDTSGSRRSACEYGRAQLLAQTEVVAMVPDLGDKPLFEAEDVDA
jgi:hypothetical protein